MRKKITTLTVGILLIGATAFASPVEFNKGSIELELGATLNSKSKGAGVVPNIETSGKFGYKAVATFGLSDKWALQYKHGNFTSVDSRYGPLTTYVESIPSDFNVLYQLNPTITLMAGYEYTDITYGKYVNAASSSALHFGLTAKYPVSKRTTLFTTLMTGKDVSLQEYGVSYKASNVTTLNVSYADRKMKNVDLVVPILRINGKEDYTMNGITCTVGVKF